MLIAHDNQAMRAYTVSILSRHFHVVGTATDGHTAIAAASALHPDVVVLDLSMPGMNGLEAAAVLRRMEPKPEIVFLTVHDEDELVEAAREAGALGYVIKSMMVSVLPTAVREAASARPFVCRRQ